LRLGDPPHQRRLPRRVRPRDAQVGRQRDDHPDLPPHGADLRLRRIQVPARVELDHRRDAPDPHDGHGLHRLPPAVRPAVLLGHGRGREHQRHRSVHRAVPQRLLTRRRRLPRRDPVAVLRDPHAAHSGAAHRPDRRAPVPGRQARDDCSAVAPSQAQPRDREGGAGMDRAEKEEYLREYEQLKKQGKPFFPYAVMKDSTMALIVVLVIVALSLVLGAEQGPKADPTTTTYTPRPDWYFFFLFEVLRVLKPPYLVPLATIGIPTIAMILLFLLPFYDRNSDRRPERRPVAMTAMSLTIVVMAFLTYKGANAGPPTTVD